MPHKKELSIQIEINLLDQQVDETTKDFILKSQIFKTTTIFQYYLLDIEVSVLHLSIILMTEKY